MTLLCAYCGQKWTGHSHECQGGVTVTHVGVPPLPPLVLVQRERLEQIARERDEARAQHAALRDRIHGVLGRLRAAPQYELTAPQWIIAIEEALDDRP